MKHFIFALCCLLILSGCGTTMRVKSGNSALTAENVAQIQKGMTKDQVLAVLGKPFSMSDAPPLGEFWSYTLCDIQQTMHPFKTGKVAGLSRGVTVTFDQFGKVSNIAKTENDLFQPTTVAFT